MKRIGLVLSGGMGKGAYQVGALTALNRFFNPSDFTYISAASVGAINAYAYVTGQLDGAKRLWLNADPKGNKRFISSVLKSEALEEIISCFDLSRKFPCGFYVPLFDIKNKALNYYNYAEVPQDMLGMWLQASITLPLYSKGIEIGEHQFYDGAMIDNIPVYPVMEKDLDYIICIYFDEYNYVFENTGIDNRIVKLVFHDKTMISNSVYITHDSISYMVDAGYEKTMEVLSRMFVNGTDDLEYIYQMIDQQNANSGKEKAKLRITGDIVMTNINKYAKKLIRNKDIID